MKQEAGKQEKGQPMDPSIREQVVGTPSTNNQRVCHAAKTLVAEVHELFPETPVEYSNYDGRNTALDVTFDLTVLDPHDQEDSVELLALTTADVRVREVLRGENSVLVSFVASPRTQDNREPFGLAEAFDVLTEVEQ